VRTQNFAAVVIYDYFAQHPDLALHTHARIYRPSFGHENASFRENMPKMLVFNPIRTQRRRFQLVLDEIIFGVVFKYCNCKEEEISWFLWPKKRPY
jgi:hypothetical protein